MNDPDFAVTRRAVIEHMTTLGQTCGHCGRIGGCAHVSLPTGPGLDTPILEETRGGVLTRYGVDYCEECTFPIAYCNCS